MAQDYIYLTTDNTAGDIALTKSIFIDVAEKAIDELENVCRIPETRFYAPVNAKIVDNKLKLYIDLKMKYGINVNATCELLQNKIYNNILQMTGLKCSKIDLHVVGFEI